MVRIGLSDYIYIRFNSTILPQTMEESQRKAHLSLGETREIPPKSMNLVFDQIIPGERKEREASSTGKTTEQHRAKSRFLTHLSYRSQKRREEIMPQKWPPCPNGERDRAIAIPYGSSSARATHVHPVKAGGFRVEHNATPTQAPEVPKARRKECQWRHR